MVTIERFIYKHNQIFDKMEDPTFIDMVRFEAQKGYDNLATLFNQYLAFERFPEDDTECRDIVDGAMKVYFKIKGLDYLPEQEIPKDETLFLEHIKAQDYTGLPRLADLFPMFLAHERLPEDDNLCRKVVSEGINLYFQLKK